MVKKMQIAHASKKDRIHWALLYGSILYSIFAIGLSKEYGIEFLIAAFVVLFLVWEIYERKIKKK